MEAIESEESFQKMYRSQAMKIHHDGFQVFIRALVEKSAKKRGRGPLVITEPVGPR